MSLRKKNQEIENMKRMHKNELQKIECEKNSQVDTLKNEYMKKEQELLESITELTNSLNTSKGYWSNNLHDLQMFLQEQQQNLHNYNNWRHNKLANIDNELENLLNCQDNLSNPPLSSRRESARPNRPPANMKNELADLSNMLSPIHGDNNKMKFAKLGLKNMMVYKDEPLPSSRRNNVKENIESNISVNSSKIYSDLSFINMIPNRGELGPNEMECIQENSNISLKKAEPEWDSSLEDEESVDNLSELGKAMEMLYKANLFEPVNY